MADEPKTDGTGTATGTQTPGAKTATDAGSDKTSAVPYERFEGVVAERNRLKEQNAALEAKHQQILDEHKTEDEKRIAAAAKQIADTEYKPKVERVDALESFLKSDLEATLVKLGDHRDAVDSSAPIEVQLRQARAIVAILETKKPGAVQGGGSPPDTSEARKYTKAQWDEFVNSARDDPKGFQANRDEMYAAAREGRVEGLRNAVG